MQKKARPQRRRLSKGLRPGRRKKGHVERNAHGSGHLGFANGAWPPDRSAATKICGTESVLLAVAERQFCPTGAPSGLLKASLCYGKPAVVPTPQDWPRAGPFAIEIVLELGQNWTSVQNRVSTPNAKPRGALEEESVLPEPLAEDSTETG